MALKRQSGTKAQRQNQHMRKLIMKINRFNKREWNTAGLEKELAYCTGDADRPSFSTGRATDPRLKKYNSAG